MGKFDKFKEKIKTAFKPSSDSLEEGDAEEEYVELDTSKEEGKSKVIVRPFSIEDFSDVKPILDSLRVGRTIALINIKPLKDKDLIELKRTISKLKKTTEAIEGDIAGFGDDWIIVTPTFAQIYRSKQMEEIKEE